MEGPFESPIPGSERHHRATQWTLKTDDMEPRGIHHDGMGTYQTSNRRIPMRGFIQCSRRGLDDVLYYHQSIESWILGDAHGYDMESPEKTELLRGRNDPKDVVSLSEIAGALNESPDDVEGAIGALAEKGRVIRHPDGVSLE